MGPLNPTQSASWFHDVVVGIREAGKCLLHYRELRLVRFLIDDELESMSAFLDLDH